MRKLWLVMATAFCLIAALAVAMSILSASTRELEKQVRELSKLVEAQR